MMRETESTFIASYIKIEFQHETSFSLYFPKLRVQTRYNNVDSPTSKCT